MAPIVRGTELSARSKKVTTIAETATGGTYQAFNFYSETADPGESVIDDPELGGTRNNLVDPVQGVKGMPKPQFGMQVPMDLAQIGWHLAGMWGAPTTTGSSAPYSHVFKSGNTAVQLRTAEFPVTSDIFKIVDAYGVSQMAINMAKEDGTKRLDLTCMARSVRRVAATLSASITAVPARKKIPAVKGLLKVNDVAFGNVLGGQIQLANGMFQEMYMDDTEWPSAVEIGTPSFQMTPQIRVRADAKAMLDLFDGLTPFTIELSWTLDTDTFLKIACANVIAQPVLPKGNGTGAMDVSPTFLGSQTASADMLTITLSNAVASYAS